MPLIEDRFGQFISGLHVGFFRLHQLGHDAVQFIKTPKTLGFFELLDNARLLHDRDATSGRVKNLGRNARRFFTGKPRADRRDMLWTACLYVRLFHRLAAIFPQWNGHARERPG